MYPSYIDLIKDVASQKLSNVIIDDDDVLAVLARTEGGEGYQTQVNFLRNLRMKLLKSARKPVHGSTSVRRVYDGRFGALPTLLMTRDELEKSALFSKTLRDNFYVAYENWDPTLYTITVVDIAHTFQGLQVAKPSQELNEAVVAHLRQLFSDVDISTIPLIDTIEPEEAAAHP